MVAQWFPQLGVWGEDGWNAYPFHSSSEFFADFGNYDVKITLPEEYVTAATGLPVATEVHSDGTQTVHYQANGVIDFAWSAFPHFKQVSRIVNGIEVLYVYLPEHDFTVEPAYKEHEIYKINTLQMGNQKTFLQCKYASRGGMAILPVASQRSELDTVNHESTKFIGESLSSHLKLSLTISDLASRDDI